MGHCRHLKIILWDGMTQLSNWRIYLQRRGYCGEHAWSNSLKGLIASHKKYKDNNRTSNDFLCLTLNLPQWCRLVFNGNMENDSIYKLIYKQQQEKIRLLLFLATQGSNEIHLAPAIPQLMRYFKCCASVRTALSASLIFLFQLPESEQSAGYSFILGTFRWIHVCSFSISYLIIQPHQANKCWWPELYVDVSTHNGIPSVACDCCLPLALAFVEWIPYFVKIGTDI